MRRCQAVVLLSLLSTLGCSSTPTCDNNRVSEFLGEIFIKKLLTEEGYAKSHGIEVKYYDLDKPSTSLKSVRTQSKNSNSSICAAEVDIFLYPVSLEAIQIIKNRQIVEHLTEEQLPITVFLAQNVTYKLENTDDKKDIIITITQLHDKE